MGLQYDDTPSADWIVAKVYAEYGIRLVNDYIRQNSSCDIPMPIVRAFGRSLERAANKLLEAFTEQGDAVLDAKSAFDSSLIPLLAKSNLQDGQLAGSLPVAKLAEALTATRDLFAHVYADSTYEARFEMLSVSNETTDEGFVGEWDSSTYDSPEEDPEAEITPWDEAKEQIYDENHDAGWEHWETNETEVFASLYFDGPYAGHGGGSIGPTARSVKTECTLLTAPPPK